MALQWRDLHSFAWPGVSDTRREQAVRDRSAAVAATPRLTAKGAAHSAEVAAALRRWRTMVHFIQTRPDTDKKSQDGEERAAQAAKTAVAKKESEALLPLVHPRFGKGLKRKAAMLAAPETGEKATTAAPSKEDQDAGVVPLSGGARSSAAAGAAAEGAATKLLDDPLDPLVGPLSTMDERVWLILQLMADVRDRNANPDDDDTTRERGTGQALSTKKQKRPSASTKGKSVAGAVAANKAGGVVSRNMRTVGLSYAAMIVNRSWDVVAAKCGYADDMSMFWPYLIWCAEKCKLKPLLNPSDGFSPRCQRYRLFHGLPTSLDPDVVDPVALATFSNAPDEDQLLRKAAAQYARHMTDMMGSPELWSVTYGPLSRQTDKGKVSGSSCMPHESALVGGVVPVLVPALRKLWLDDERVPLLADGVPSSDMLDAVADGRPFSSVSVTDLRVIESALAERVQMAL